MVSENQYWFWDNETFEWFESDGYGIYIENEPFSKRVSFVVVWGTPDDRDEKRDRLIAAAKFAMMETE